jgi:hypothetical protein
MQKKVPQNSESFHEKSSEELETKGTFLNIINSINDKPIANIIYQMGKTETYCPSLQMI